MPHAASPLDSLLKRDRLMILAGLVGVIAVSWTYLVIDAMRMNAMGGAGGMGEIAMAAIRPWTALDAGLMFAMWAVMMVAMMVPSAAPMILLYGMVLRKQRKRGHVLAPTGAFVTGYLIAWTAFGAVATALQWSLEQAALLTPMMAFDGAIAAGAVLVAAGAYQLTPVKRACLEHCRAPAEFLARHWRKGSAGAVVMGLHHGAYCLGCCWFLMALLFVGGVMNLLWVAAITGLVLIEKLTPIGDLIARVTGLLLIVSGGFIALRGTVA